MSTAVQEQAAFFQWVHQMIEQQEGAATEDGRRHPRSAYPRLQMVAPVIAGRPPEQGDFREVRCLDLSAGGISFLTTEVPESGQYIVALGTPPNVIHLTAEVVRDAPQRLVGCRFTGRLDAR